MATDMINQFKPLSLCDAAKENNKTFKKLFKGKINGSFLIKIKSEVVSALGNDLLNYYPLDFSKESALTGNTDAAEYDICKLITGTHRHYSIFLSDEDIRDLEDSSEYAELLTNEVIEKIKLRRYASCFFRKQPLIQGDEFLYFPLPYELFCICLRALELMENTTEKDFRLEWDIIKNALSALTLIENNLLTNAYPICRGMVEIYLKTLLFKKYPDVRPFYEKFREYEILHACCNQQYPEEFEKLYKKRKATKCKKKIEYLHYGWFDYIPDYTITSPKAYTPKNMLKHLIPLVEQEEKTKLKKIERLFKMCHGYAHGNVTFVKYPLLQYFEISTMLYFVVTDIFDDICGFTGKQELDLNLSEYAKRDFRIVNRQYNNRTTENFENYYSQWNI